MGVEAFPYLYMTFEKCGKWMKVVSGFMKSNICDNLTNTERLQIQDFFETVLRCMEDVQHRFARYVSGMKREVKNEKALLKETKFRLPQ